MLLLNFSAKLTEFHALTVLVKSIRCRFKTIPCMLLCTENIRTMCILVQIDF